MNNFSSIVFLQLFLFLFLLTAKFLKRDTESLSAYLHIPFSPEYIFYRVSISLSLQYCFNSPKSPTLPNPIIAFLSLTHMPLRSIDCCVSFQKHSLHSKSSPTIVSLGGWCLYLEMLEVLMALSLWLLLLFLSSSLVPFLSLFLLLFVSLHLIPLMKIPR